MKNRFQIRLCRWLASIVLATNAVACADSLENPSSDVSKEEGVPVELSFGFANEEDGYTLTGGTDTCGGKDTQTGGFSAQLTPHTQTRTADLKPDALYQLHVLQHTQAGKMIGKIYYSKETIPIGEERTYTLTPATDCKLTVFARGNINGGPNFNYDLDYIQKAIMPSDSIKNIPTNGATQEQMNKMPYILHLPHVNVTSDGKLQSPTGTHDTRLLLKRLVAKLTVNWDYNVSGYKLKQLFLQSVPLDYTIVDKPESDGTYPSLISQFTTLEATITDENAAKGSWSCWIPANVRGENASAVTDLQRIKANAPMGSTFLNFVAGNTTDVKKKLDYRVYIGSGASTDFNIYRNKDYIYNVGFNHNGIPTSDKRVTYIDPITASTNNDNLIPTANCFMVAPGSSFCFDPFTFRQDKSDIENTVLTDFTKSTRGGIKTVELLWQTRENGDVGDPVLGIVNSSTDHSNVVEIKRTDGGTGNPTALGQCRIYCRVAANTAGGNGVIAARDAAGKILWSWHIWVTDYSPSPNGTETVLTPATKRKQKYAFHTNKDQLPMMDRNLGALEGYTEVPKTELDKAKANGLHYQWGRKDPFLSSYTNEQIQSISIANGSTAPTKGLLNAYGPDGYTFNPRLANNSRSTIENACINPTMIYSGRPWYTTAAKYWGENAEKTVYDPCPVGWKIPKIEDYSHFFSTITYTSVLKEDNETLRSKPDNNDGEYWKKGSGAKVWNDGGVLLRYDSNSEHTTYFRFTGYQEHADKFNYIGRFMCVSCRDVTSVASGFSINWGGLMGSYYTRSLYTSWNVSDAHNVRCIQERAD